MPSLIWPGKHLPEVTPADLYRDSIIYPAGRGYPKAQPENRLILGDNLAIMAALLPEYENCIDLIYADPPFFTNRNYPARIGRGEDSRKPEEWKLAEGYQDAWLDLDSYLDFLYPRLALMVRLLAPNGTLYLHLDWHADAYARLLLDELLGAEKLLNEIIWTYHGPSPIRSAFNRKHDTLLAYVKGEQYTFNADAIREPYHPNTVNTFRSSPKAGFGKVPDLERGKVPEDWWYFPVVARLHSERTGYPTQKPEALLERIIRASSNQGDLVADFFCGSGTTPVVAARLGRRFISCDVTWRAMHTTRSRLSDSIGPPFTLEYSGDMFQNLQISRSCKSRQVVEKTFKIVRADSSIKINQDLELDYWEVDPAWDGKTFKSAAQARRPTRKGAVPSEINIKTGRTICVRLVTSQGEEFQLDI